MPAKDDRYLYENIIRDEDFHSSLSRDQRNILELYYGQDLNLETTAKMMDIISDEVENTINKVFRIYRENIWNLEFINAKLSQAEIEDKVKYYEQQLMELSTGNSKLDRVMAVIYNDACKAGKDALLRYKKEVNLPKLLDARTTEFNFMKMLNLIEEIEGITKGIVISPNS